MAEINDVDLISSAALERPGKLADQLQRVADAIDRILASTTKSNAAISDSKTTSKVTKETNELLKTQKELAKAQETAAKIAKVVWLSENEVAKSYEAASKSGKQLGTVVSDLDKKMAEAANSATQYGKAQKESNQQSENAAKIYKAEAGSLEALTQKRIQLQNAILSQKKNQQDDNDLLKRGIIDRAEFNKRMAESAAVIAKNNIGIQSLNSAIKNHILSNSSLGNEYKKLTIQLEAARLKYKDLAASGTATSQQLKAQQKVFEDLNKKVLTIDQSVGQFQRNVGNYPQTFGIATQAVTRFLAAFGAVTGIALFAKTIKEVIALNTEFQYKNSTLQAVLGETKEGIKELTAQQRAYGESTIYSALQVADLQVLFSKQGLTTKEIQASTEATIDLATATGEDLAKSADTATTILKAYGLQANQTGRVVDVMTGAFNKTTLGIDNFSEAIKYVGPVAKAQGVSLEETVALLGTLADAGIRGSTAGTSLRKILSELDRGSGTLSEKLAELGKNGYSSADAMDEVGRTAYASLLILTQNAKKTDDLNESLHKVQGTAKETAKIMADNLKGDAQLLGNQFEALALDVSVGLDGSFRKIIQTATIFVRLLRGLPEFLKENKDLIIEMGIALVGLNFRTLATAASTLLLELNTKRLAIAQQLANISTKALTASLLANPIGLIIIAFAALAVAVSAYDRNSQRAIEVDKQRTEINKGLETQTKNITKAQNELNVSTDEWLKLSDEQKKSIAEQIEFTINHEKAMLSRLKVQKLQLEATAAELTLGQKLKAGVMSALTGNIGGGAASAQLSSIENITEATKGQNEAITKLEVEIDALTHLLDDNTEATKKNSDALSKAEKERILAAKRSQLELDKFRLEQQAKVQEEIIANDKKGIDDRIAASVKLETIRGQIADVIRKKELLNDKLNGADKVLIEEQTQAGKTDAARAGAKERDKLNSDEVERLYKLNLKYIQAQEDVSKQQTQRIIQEAERRIDLEVQVVEQSYLDGKISREKANLEILKIQRKSSADLINLQIETLNKQLINESEIYYKQRKKLVEESELSAEEKVLKLQLIETESAEERAKIEQKLHDLKIQLTDDAFNNTVGKYDQEIRILTKVQGFYESYSQAIQQIFQNIAQSRINHLNAESKANADKLAKDLAAAGDNERLKALIQAKAAKAEQDLEIKRRKEARKAAQIEKAFAIVSAGIQTSLAVLNALSTVKPYPAAVIAAISAGVLGGLQIASIASKQVPAYEMGTESAIGGLSLVGEKGPELMISPSGQTSLTPDGPTLMNIPRGTEIIPNNKTMQMLAINALSQNGGSSQKDTNSDALLDEVRKLNGNIKNIKHPKQPNLTRSGAIIYRGIQASDTHTKLVRDINLGRWL